MIADERYDVWGEDNKPYCTRLNLTNTLTLKQAEQLKKEMESFGWKNIKLVPHTK